jgi:hypothetical protein
MTNAKSTELKGYLYKEGQDILHRLKKRWFVLKGTQLHYYVDESESVCTVFFTSSPSFKTDGSVSLFSISFSLSYWVYPIGSLKNKEERSN